MIKQKCSIVAALNPNQRNAEISGVGKGRMRETYSPSEIVVEQSCNVNG